MFETANYIEASLWAGFGLVFLVCAARPNRQIRRQCLVAAVAFILFGLSDVIEVRTGAWWRPWWLLVWKGACLMVFAWLLYGHLRGKRANSGV